MHIKIFIASEITRQSSFKCNIRSSTCEKGDNTNEKVAFFTLITNINNFVGFVKEETKIKEIIQEIEDNYKISDEDRNTIHKELEKEIEKKK